MKKFFWPILITIAALWIAIAYFWAGTEETAEEPREIFAPPVTTPAPLATVAPSPEATPTATPTATPSATPTSQPDVLLVSPTVEVNFRY